MHSIYFKVKIANRAIFPAIEGRFAIEEALGENQRMAGTGPLDLNAKLKRLVETVDAANILTEPLTASIRSLLTLSASQIDCDEASVLVRDGDDGDLRFLIAIGRVADQLLNLRVPAGKGIAGFVLSSGQPMAIAEAGEDESFYAEVDKETGYSTQTILATPLRHGGDVIGVLEYINRRGEPPFQPFTPDEMDQAAGFADAIAALVNAYQSAKIFRDLGERMLSSEDQDAESVRSWLAGIRSSPEHREMMDLAVLIREIANRGDAERTLAREILESVIRFSEKDDHSSFLY
jgi:signal transduction protein with GAF and PtsI domain